VFASTITADLELLGTSPAMAAVREEIECAARSDAKVLITGETGVGKEIVARLIHQRSARADRQLVAINCAGVPDSLLESELFGHVRGSFTGAFRDKPGILEMAPNGTVFLDEIGEMSLRMQSVLLRFLETGEIQRIGATQSHARVNVRLIAATNRDLQRQIESGAFREDLYFRVNVVHLRIPPLRERREDVPMLVQHFLAIYSRQYGAPCPELPRAVMDALVDYRWPGNIRELRNVAERIVLKAAGQPVRPIDLPPDLAGRIRAASSTNGASHPHFESHQSVVDRMVSRLLDGGESFWTVAYVDFMAHDITRQDLRQLIQIGLERTNGSYEMVLPLFNMPADDYKRFLTFLRKHNCHVPFQRFPLPSVPAPCPSNGPIESAGNA
jgi:transcriptional regulator with GAF, ATPase, and Fis domain